MAGLAASALKCAPGRVLVASTGVIGKQLPMAAIGKGVPAAAARLSPSGGTSFARAIMTTDLARKEYAVALSIGGKTVHIGGCCKGSGMIQPNMATMLAFAATDADIALPALKKAFSAALSKSFNRITVDGDTSTNDTLILLANGRAGNPVIRGGKDFDRFTEALCAVFTELAKKIARDGEGATKMAVVTVRGAKNDIDAEKAARAVAKSPLVKTALFGNDPNWGRILAAVGYSGIPFNPARCSLALCGIRLVDKGEPLVFDAKKASSLLRQKEVDIRVDLKGGKGAATMFFCDFSYNYVKINAEYHT
jgi:glutamate N-acetyltransferase/amino-acid N-acetyltransferase